MTLGLVVIALFTFYFGMLVLINLAMALVLVTGLLLTPLWAPLSAVVLNAPRRYR